jgi:hypothetical protein
LKKSGWIPVILVLVLMLGSAGCSSNYQELWARTQNQEEPLLRVKIQFTNQREAVCYVKSLGLENSARVYQGGSSTNYMYDRDGQIIGSFNYQQVLFMNIIPEDATEQN